MKKFLIWFLVIDLVLVIVIIVGPKVEDPNLDRVLPQVTTDLRALEKKIDSDEAEFINIKPDNESRIIWADSAYKKTPYSVVYLHGWSASQAEGAPLHTDIASRYGCNLYLPRLYGHGLVEDEPMLNMTAKKLVESAKEALAVAQQLGDEVIVVGTSTGGSIALYLAGENDNIAALILYSPNIRIYDANAWLLDEHWGLQIARLVKGSDYNEWEIEPERKNYWTSKYRLEALPHLEELISSTMVKENFKLVNQPVFMGYYYKNDTAQDNTVSVPAMLDMYDQLGTSADLKRKVAFPEAGAHVIASDLTSKDIETVRKETYKYLEKVVGLVPDNND